MQALCHHLNDQERKQSNKESKSVTQTSSLEAGVRTWAASRREAPPGGGGAPIRICLKLAVSTDPERTPSSQRMEAAAVAGLPLRLVSPHWSFAREHPLLREPECTQQENLNLEGPLLQEKTNCDGVWHGAGQKRQTSRVLIVHRRFRTQCRAPDGSQEITRERGIPCPAAHLSSPGPLCPTATCPN